MTTRPRHQRIARRLAGTAVAAALLLGIVCLLTWIGYRRVPSWYKPVAVLPAELTRVRNSLPNTYQRLNSQINEGEVFEFTLSDRTVTEWIVARAELYPDAGDWVPAWLEEPAVTFDGDCCIIGARLVHDDWRTIIGIRLVVDITDESVTIRIKRATAGWLPLPVSQLLEPLARLMSNKALDAEIMPDPAAGIVRDLSATGPAELITAGMTWRNQFITRNGNKSFKLLGASAANGVLRVRIAPL